MVFHMMPINTKQETTNSYKNTLFAVLRSFRREGERYPPFSQLYPPFRQSGSRFPNRWIIFAQIPETVDNALQIPKKVDNFPKQWIILQFKLPLYSTWLVHSLSVGRMGVSAQLQILQLFKNFSTFYNKTWDDFLCLQNSSKFYIYKILR